jgi:hypothetical protein
VNNLESRHLRFSYCGVQNSVNFYSNQQVPPKFRSKLVISGILAS